jgi:triosephosphate isomerase
LQEQAIDQNYRNGVADSITNIVKNLNAAKLDSTTEVVISPPSLYLTLTRGLADSKIGVAAQNVFDKPNGAFTGEISVEQLKDTKIDWVVIGHSERRVILKETDEVCSNPHASGNGQHPSSIRPTPATDKNRN